MFLRNRFDKFLAAATAGLNGPASERGFTLIELHIVLVIVGLIITGILKGLELFDQLWHRSPV